MIPNQNVLSEEHFRAVLITNALWLMNVMGHYVGDYALHMNPLAC